MQRVETDLVIVGAGAAGLLAAVAARRLGHQVLLIDAAAKVGGATALGDGRLWLPANHLTGKVGVSDSTAEAGEYLDAVLGATTPASTAERRAAFVRTAPRLARWLTESRLPLAAVKGLPDFHQDLPGSKPQGRVLASQQVDRGGLGEWTERLHSPRQAAAKLWSDRVLDPVLRRQGTQSEGEALSAALLRRATANGVEIWLEATVAGLIGDSSGVRGAIIERRLDPEAGASQFEVHARRGVVLAAGGFEASQELREEHLPLPTEADWSLTGGLNHGRLLEQAQALGAVLTGESEAWWQPVMLAGGVAYSLTRARALPHGLLVDQAGDRFTNESAPGVLLGRQLYERSRGVRAIPSYLILDNRHRQQVPLGPWAPGSTPRKAIEAGEIVKANSLNDLAEELGIDRAGLIGSVVRFNSFAVSGRDLDFNRGRSAWDKARGEEGKRKNPSLGKVDKAPFWAVRVYPGDEGTKGGLMVDADARVLDGTGAAIPGLFAAGGTAASMMGRTSPAPGSALAAALVEAFRAVTSLPTANEG